MKSRYDALVRNRTWDSVPVSPSMNVVDCKWRFHIKHHPNGSIDRFKARLIAKGFTQRPALDYHSMLSLVVMPTIVRLVLAIATQRSWPIHQLDMNDAFLDLKKETSKVLRFFHALKASSCHNKSIFGFVT